MSRREHLIILLFFAILVVGGVYFAFSSDPEAVLAQSDDHALTLSGRTRTIDRPEVVTVAEHDSFFQGVYSLLPHATVFESPLKLSPQNSLAHIYHFNATLNVWEQSLSWIDASGLYGLTTSAIPVVDTNIAQTTSAETPPNAVGYREIYAVHSRGTEGDLIQVPSEPNEGGCGGATTAGDGSQIITSEIPATPEQPAITVIRIWTTRASGGCPVDEPLKALK